MHPTCPPQVFPQWLSAPESCRFVTKSAITSAVARILILDDDLALVDLVETVIREAGHSAVAAGAIEDVPGDVQIDLVMSDLIPVKPYRRETAKAWVDALRERYGVPIVVLTGHRAALTEPDSLGAEEVVGKPFDIEALAARVESVLARSHILKTP